MAVHTVLMDLSKTDHRLVNDQTFRHLPASWRHGAPGLAVSLVLRSPGPVGPRRGFPRVIHQRALHRLVMVRPLPRSSSVAEPVCRSLRNAQDMEADWDGQPSIELSATFRELIAALTSRS